MVDFDIFKHVPDFILSDKNGYAIAKAIEAGLLEMNTIISDSLDMLYDFDKMPEWYLDEIAWEMGCLYDYTASITQKREWIRNAKYLNRIYGTPAALKAYLSAYYKNIQIKDTGQVVMAAYRFTVTAEGDWGGISSEWGLKAIEYAKNARSVLSGFRLSADFNIGINGTAEVRETGLDHFILDKDQVK